MVRSQVNYQRVPSSVVEDNFIVDDDAKAFDLGVDYDKDLVNKCARVGGPTAIIAYHLITLSIIYFFWLDENQTIVNIVFCCIPFSIILLGTIWIMDPGIVVRDDPAYVQIENDLIEQGTNNDNKTVTDTEITIGNKKYVWCRKCSLYRPKIGYEHCVECGFCIRNFIQHCEALGTCLAERNHRVVIIFALIGSNILGCTCYVCYVFLRNYDFTSNWQWWVVLGLVFLYGYSTLAIGSYTIIQLFLVGSGITEENIRHEPNCSRVIYQILCCGNAYNFWFASLPPGYSRCQYANKQTDAYFSFQ